MVAIVNEVKKIPYDYKLAFEVEKELIRTHPNAQYIRVEARGGMGLVATCEEGGTYISVGEEITAYLNRKLQTTGPEVAPPLCTPE